MENKSAERPSSVNDIINQYRYYEYRIFGRSPSRTSRKDCF
ncbi:MAG: hypothetical protein ACLRSW_17540 [Christensenellaceae bacterium]